MIPGWGAKIQHASRAKEPKIKQKQYCNKFKTLKWATIKKIKKKSEYSREWGRD